MSTIFTIISPNAIRDIHGLLINVQSKTPGMIYRFGDDDSKYSPGFLPDVFTWIRYKSTRNIDWTSERSKDGDRNWQYEVRVPVCSNCPTWELAFVLIEKIAAETDGVIFTNEMDAEQDVGLSKAAFEDWRKAFSCITQLDKDIELTISLSEFRGDVTIFGTYACFTFNKNIIGELKLKKSVSKEFERRMLQLQNAFIDEAYTQAPTVEISGKSKKRYRAKFCSGIPFTLIVNDELDYIAFSRLNSHELCLVPAKKVREVMPARCFFDEYSFYVDNAAFASWESILQKAEAVHEELE